MAEVNKPIVDPDRIVKEVFDRKGIEAKTELNIVQIESVSKLKTLSVLFGSTILDQHLAYFMTLQKSKDRKSMAEFVESLKTKKSELIERAKNFTLLG